MTTVTKPFSELERMEPTPGCPYELHRWMMVPGEEVVWAEELDTDQLLIETETVPTTEESQ